MLILVGVLLLLANLDVVDLDVGDLASTWWPSILVLLGVWQLVTSRGANLPGPCS